MLQLSLHLSALHLPPWLTTALLSAFAPFPCCYLSERGQALQAHRHRLPLIKQLDPLDPQREVVRPTAPIFLHPMDHLPYPGLGVPPIVVPYLADFEYDGKDFATFPDRVGFWKDGTLDLDRPCRQLAALAQAWLFFGLIDVFTKHRGNRGVLVRKRNSNRADEGVVDTTMLGEILAERFRLSRLLFSSPEVLKNIRAQLMEAARASRTLDQIQADDSSSSAVFLSIKILIIYLSEIFEAAFLSHMGPYILSIPSWDSFRSGILGRRRLDGGFPAPARLLMDRMLQSGWCIHQIMEVFRAHNYCTVYYYSSIARAESWIHITHKACTEEQCVAYNIKDDSKYKICHIKECSGCEFVGPSEDEIAEIVRHGDIPLIELNPVSLENQSQLTVRSATPYSQYTAISHVWIDGHGNPTANALPKCQLQRLAARLSAISNAHQSGLGRLWKWLRDPSPISPLIWMDTLCISPRGDSEDQKFLRKKAIHRMALIYAGAEQVLVLDAELDKLTYEGKPRELIDALISYSRWSGRCWTLEEGALARKCLFQLKDAVIEATWDPKFDQQVIMGLLVNAIYFLRHMFHIWPLRKITLHFAHDFLRRELATAALRSMQTDIDHASHANRRIAPGRDLQVEKFVRTWNEIGRRSTTRPEDIHPIIANLTDFSAAQIMGLETPVLRTKTIVHCIGRFPLDILWTPCARPQAKENCADRWIPSTPGPEPLLECAKLMSTGEGLVVDADNNSEHPETIWIPCGMVAPRFCFRWPQDGKTEFWCVIECVIAEDDALPRSASETACLILSPNTVNEDTTSTLPVLRGARLLVTDGNLDMSECLYLRYDCPLIYRIQRHRPDVEEIHDTPIMTVNIVSRSQKLIIESRE